MRLVIAFVNIVIALLMALFAFSALGMYFGGNQKNYDQHLLLKTNGIEVPIVADSAFIPATMKATNEEAYALKYTFVVAEVSYKGIYYTKDTSNIIKDQLKSTYLAENPSINAVDIDERLAELEANMDSTDDLKYGGFAALLSIGLLFFGIRSARLHKKNKT